ncbi:hypothetical protein L6452_31924 [Arctium lappa]|uniref:Uncharacterized protein n=1 Tax=Arctium lappa TaxID=4217 RepID=A0ACB8Z4A2_ARCLA|nr:hypothetical protein L6452_31924 [Arctium lappa]
MKDLTMEDTANNHSQGKGKDREIIEPIREPVNEIGSSSTRFTRSATRSKEIKEERQRNQAEIEKYILSCGNSKAKIEGKSAQGLQDGKKVKGEENDEIEKKRKTIMKIRDSEVPVKFNEHEGGIEAPGFDLGISPEKKGSGSLSVQSNLSAYPSAMRQSSSDHYRDKGKRVVTFSPIPMTSYFDDSEETHQHDAQFEKKDRGCRRLINPGEHLRSPFVKRCVDFERGEANS